MIQVVLPGQVLPDMPSRLPRRLTASADTARDSVVLQMSHITGLLDVADLASALCLVW